MFNKKFFALVEKITHPKPTILLLDRNDNRNQAIHLLIIITR